MNLQFFFEKLESSDTFKNFMKEHPSAYLCSGFLVSDLADNSENKCHFDFFAPKTGKTFSFEMEKEIKLTEIDRGDRILDKKVLNLNFDLDEIKTKIMQEMASRNISNKIQKMIFSLQNLNNKDMLLGTIFISGLGILKVDYSVSENRITDFEKKSFFDMVKIVGKK